MSEKKIRKHPNYGGKRKGSGRKTDYDVPTTSVWIPLTLKEEVLKMRELYKRHIPYTILPLPIIVPAPDLSFQPAPLYATHIPAGFPSPADDYVESRLDLNEYFIHSPASTFFYVQLAIQWI